MSPDALRELLARIRDGTVTPEEGEVLLSSSPYEDTGFGAACLAHSVPSARGRK